MYNEAFEASGSLAQVETVIEDKARGLVALVGRGADEAEVQAVLGNYERPWDWAK